MYINTFSLVFIPIDIYTFSNKNRLKLKSFKIKIVLNVIQSVMLKYLVSTNRFNLMERRDDHNPTRRTQNDDECHWQNAENRFRIKDLLNERNKRKKKKRKFWKESNNN